VPLVLVDAGIMDELRQGLAPGLTKPSGANPRPPVCDPKGFQRVIYMHRSTAALLLGNGATSRALADSRAAT
jgi:hypothetical protein